MVEITSNISLKMSDSGGTDEDLGFYGDGISPLKSAKSSVESPPSIDKNSKKINTKFNYYIFIDDNRSSSGSPLLDTQPLPAEDITICPYCSKNFRKVTFFLFIKLLINFF